MLFIVCVIADLFDFDSEKKVIPKKSHMMSLDLLMNVRIFANVFFYAEIYWFIQSIISFSE